MASFTPSGVEFVAKGLSGYLGDLHKADIAQQNLGKSASNIGSHFASAQSGVSSFASTVGNSSGVLSSFVSSLGQMAVVAGGNLLASGFQALAGGVRDFASAGLEAVSHAQTLEASLGALLTQNNLYQQTTETMTVAVGNLVEIQADAAKKSDDLAFKQRELTAEINTQNASIQEQRQRIMQMADGLDKNQQVARLQEMEVALEGMNRELAEAGTEQGKLNNITQEYETVSKTAWQQVMNMGDAQALAKDQTKDLLGFIEKLAIVSPFEQEDVEKVTQYAIGAGLGVDTTKEFTQGFLDLAAAVGITSPNLDEAAYQLLQVKKAGILTAVDLRQLSTRGIDLAKIIGVQMGMSVDEFNAKAKTTPAIFDQLIQAVTDYSQNTFAGTSQAMSQSIEGFRSTVSDLFTQSAKKVLRPLVDAVTPTVAEMISVAASFISGGQAEAIGQALADSVVSGFSVISTKVTELFAVFQESGTGGLLTALGIGPEGIELFEKVTVLITDVSDVIMSVLTPALEGLTAGGVMDQINIGLAFLNEHFEEVKGALLGIGVVVAGGIFAALVAGILSLVTPVGLLVAGAAVLGAAWAGNWFGIRDATLQAWAAIQPVLTQLITWLQTNIPIAVQIVSDIWNNNFLPGLVAIGEFITGTLVPAFQALNTWLAQNIPPAIQKLSDLWTNTLLPALQVGFENFTNVLELLEALGILLNAVVGKALEAIAAIFKNILVPALVKVGDLLNKVMYPIFQKIGTTVKEDVSPGLRDLGDSVLPMLTEGIEFVNEAIQRTISFFKSLAETINNISLPEWLQTHSPPPLADGLNMIADGAISASKAIAGMQQNLLSSTASTDRFIDSLNMGGFAANSMLSNWNDVRDILHLNIGANMGRLATGELSGADIPRILGEQAGVWNVPPGMLQDIAEAQGLVDHFSETFLAFQKQIRIENLTNMTQMAGSFSSLGSSFADMLQTQMGDSKAAKAEVDKLIQSNTKLDKSNLDITDSISDQQQKMAILQAELADLTTQEELDILAIDKKKLAIDELTEAMEKNRQKLVENQRALAANSLELATLATSSDAGMIEALRAFLADDSQDMFHMHKELADGTISDFFIDRNAAQIRYNELLEEQQRQEELITRQKEAQGQLDKLKAQLDLIKLGEQLGGNIFQGITFGLNASVEDLLAATNAIVEAMVTQIDQDLQLGSPSRLMIGMFENVMEGAAIGVQKGAGALEYAFNSSLSPFLNAGQRMLAPTGTSYNSTNNNYFNMNVSTGASASSVIRQYEVARSMI